MILIKLLVLLAQLLFLSAILTPFLYAGLQLIFGTEIWPFSRIYDRVALLVLIFLVYFQRRHFDLEPIRQIFVFKQTGAKKKALRSFMVGLMLTLLPIIIVIPLMVSYGQLFYESYEPAYYLRKLFKLIFTILIVSVLEELVFRVFLFKNLAKKYHFHLAALATAFIYSLAHFITPVKSFSFETFDLLAGFRYYLVVTDSLMTFDLLAAAVILLTIGYFLAYVYYKTNNFFLIAGLHGGWIAAIKLTKITTDFAPELVITSRAAKRYYLLNYPLAWLAVALAIILTLIYIRYAKDSRCVE